MACELPIVCGQSIQTGNQNIGYPIVLVGPRGETIKKNNSLSVSRTLLYDPTSILKSERINSLSNLVYQMWFESNTYRLPRLDHYHWNPDHKIPHQRSDRFCWGYIPTR
jgi:hypothetical protein